MPILLDNLIIRKGQEALILNRCCVAISGRAYKTGVIYPQAKIFLMSSAMSLVSTTRSDSSGNYSFKGVIKGEEFTIIGFDPRKQMNAVIQTNVVPK